MEFFNPLFPDACQSIPLRDYINDTISKMELKGQDEFSALPRPVTNEDYRG